MSELESIIAMLDEVVARLRKLEAQSAKQEPSTISYGEHTLTINGREFRCFAGLQAFASSRELPPGRATSAWHAAATHLPEVALDGHVLDKGRSVSPSTYRAHTAVRHGYDPYKKDRTRWWISTNLLRAFATTIGRTGPIDGYGKGSRELMESWLEV